MSLFKFQLSFVDISFVALGAAYRHTGTIRNDAGGIATSYDGRYTKLARYCYGIVKNHPFVDGNKRAGVLAGNAFLALNGYRFQPQETEIVHMILALADSTIGEEELASWFSENSEKL